MTDPQKKSNWNELAEQIGAATPQETTAPEPTPKKPVEAATPPPPPKRPPAPVKKSGWGAIASLLGIESAPAVKETAVEETAVEVTSVEETQAEAPRPAPPAATPSAPATVETQPEPVARREAWARHHEDTQPEADEPFATPRTGDVVTESSSGTDESSDATSRPAEEPSVSSRGSSRGRRRRGGQPRSDESRSDESRDEAGAASQEPVARSAPYEAEAEPAANFADDDDDDPLLLRDTFVDEVENSYDDLTDSIDNAESASPVEAEEERPKKRRRRGRRRGRREGGSTSAAGEKTEEATGGTADQERVSDDRVSEALGDALPSDAEEKAGGDVGGAQPETDEKTTRKRRRGRRRRGGKREESAPDDAKTSETAATTEPNETTEISAKTAADVTPAVVGESYDDDDFDDAAELEEFDVSEENGEAESRHRKIPTWSDAIGDIVDKNLATRSKNPNPPRRGRGGRGRQGDRTSK